MVRKTKEDALETRNQLLDAAEKTFLEKGFSHTSLKDVALVAGLTRGAVYWHFKNKADLLEALIERVRLPAETLGDCGAAGEDLEPLDRLRQFAVQALKETAIGIIAYAVARLAAVRKGFQQRLLGNLAASCTRCRTEHDRDPLGVLAQELDVVDEQRSRREAEEVADVFARAEHLAGVVRVRQ